MRCPRIIVGGVNNPVKGHPNGSAYGKLKRQACGRRVDGRGGIRIGRGSTEYRGLGERDLRVNQWHELGKHGRLNLHQHLGQLRDRLGQRCGCDRHRDE